MKITENTLISELLDLEEDVTPILKNHGLFCLGCPGSYTESLAEAAKGHGADVQKLINDLNDGIKGDL